MKIERFEDIEAWQPVESHSTQSSWLAQDLQFFHVTKDRELVERLVEPFVI